MRNFPQKIELLKTGSMNRLVQTFLRNPEHIEHSLNFELVSGKLMRLFSIIYHDFFTRLIFIIILFTIDQSRAS